MRLCNALMLGLAVAGPQAGAAEPAHGRPCPPAHGPVLPGAVPGRPHCPPPHGVLPPPPAPHVPPTPRPPEKPGVPPAAPPTAPEPGAAPPPADTAADAAAAALAQAPVAGTAGEGGFNPSMLGDQLSSVPGIAFGRQRPFGQANRGTVLVPSVRGFKIAENESPRPRDRVYFGFNYFDDVNQAVNRRFGTDVAEMRAFRETFGLEKTFRDGDLSIGLRLPLNTLDVDTFRFEELRGTSTDVGDLTVITKFAWVNDRRTGNVFCTGLAVTAPTGPDTFASSGLFSGPHGAVIHPYLGYIVNFDRLFVHGFSALDVPTKDGDVTMMVNDIGVGYFLFRDDGGDGRLLTGVVPTLEVHVNTPLNHRGGLRPDDPVGTPDVVSLTAGTTFLLGQRATLAVGFVTPLTGPRPYDYEVLLQLNWRFGATAGTPSAL